MNIYVLLKRTFDTEAKVTIENGAIKEDGVDFIINPYDEYAIEEAINQRDAHGGEITVVSVGKESSEKQLRTALAMGADKAVLIDIKDELTDIDSGVTSSLLTTYLKDKEVDLILTGNVTVDKATGQVGPRLGEALNISHVSTITGLVIEDSTAHVVKDVEGDEAHIDVELPLLVTCQQGLNEPRYPSLPGIMKAKKKPFDTLSIEDLGLDLATLEPQTEMVEIFPPKEKEAGRKLEGEPDEQVKELVNLLKNEDKII